MPNSPKWEFISVTPDGVKARLTLTVDGDRLTLDKGDGFDAWRADTTPVTMVAGGDPMPKHEADLLTLVGYIRAWLDGKEMP